MDVLGALTGSKGCQGLAFATETQFTITYLLGILMPILESETHRDKREWLSNFLWHWRNSGALTDETAEAVLHVLATERGKTGAWQCPDPQDLLQILETS